MIPKSAILTLALLCAACASQPASKTSSMSEGMAGAVTQPFRDLNIMREEQQAALLQAAAAPYKPPEDCVRGERELVSLNEALGPDIDASAGAKSGVGEFVGEFAIDAVRGVTSLPFRGIVRRLTGADKREKAAKTAVFAGALRRAYLKGFAGGARCAVAE